MCVLRISLHLIAILWKKNAEGSVLFFACETNILCFCVFVHYGISTVCPQIDIR